MGIFSNKTPVQIETYCREFYDMHLLHPVVRDVDMGIIHSKVVKDVIVEVEPRFTAIDGAVLHSELILIRFEVFGLVWLHTFGERSSVLQTDITRRYLEDQGRSDIWEELLHYNKVIAQSCLLGQTSDTPMGRAYITSINIKRFELFKSWVAQGFEETAVARAANRIPSNKAWKKKFTPVYLAGTLIDRLGLTEISDDAFTRLTFSIRGHYDGSRQALQEIKLQ
ncbi:MAG: hypothetical protein ACYDCO_02220 [Armatimonadota bacterium]